MRRLPIHKIFVARSYIKDIFWYIQLFDTLLVFFMIVPSYVIFVKRPH